MSTLSQLRTALQDLVVWRDEAPAAPAAAVEADNVLAREVGAGIRPPTLRIWQNAPCLVVTVRETRLPGYALAVRALEADGCPVVVRDSGGTAVPHGPGILQVSLALPQCRVPAHGLEGVYEALCEPVRRALDAVGVSTAYGEVPGSFCDGRFNLVAAGRKIAGTSQRWRGGLPPSNRPDSSVLAHMVLFIEADMDDATHLVNRFYAEAGGERRFDPAAVVSAARLVSGRFSTRALGSRAMDGWLMGGGLTRAVADRITDAAVDLLGSTPGPSGDGSMTHHRPSSTP